MELISVVVLIVLESIMIDVFGLISVGFFVEIVTSVCGMVVTLVVDAVMKLLSIVVIVIVVEAISVVLLVLVVVIVSDVIAVSA